jgi:hypothetical protein
VMVDGLLKDRNDVGVWVRMSGVIREWFVIVYMYLQDKIDTAARKLELFLIDSS